MKREEIEARYRQVLAWDRAGVDYRHMAGRLGLEPYRVQRILVTARRWDASAVERVTSESSIEMLRLRRDAIVGLQRAGITTVGHVVALGDDDLLRIRGLGARALAHMRADLAARYDGQERP